MSSSLSWGNVPSVGASNQRAKTTTLINQQQQQQKRSTAGATNSHNNHHLLNQNNKENNDIYHQTTSSSQRTDSTVEEFVQRVTNLSKQVEQYKQLSNQRAQHVAISSFNNSINNNNSNGLDNFHSDVSLRVGGNDITKKIRSIRQWCTSEVNELKKISNRIGSKIGNENRLLMESGGLNSSTETNSSNTQHETMVRYNRVKNDLTKTITVLKDVIRRDKEWIAQQTKQKQEQFAAHHQMMDNGGHYNGATDEEDEIQAEDQPLLMNQSSGSLRTSHHHPVAVDQELQENALVSWQDSTLNVEMKIALEEYEDLKTYQSEYHELNHLFQSFATLVDEQDPMLDTIHTNVITSKDHVERGVESLKESNKLRKTGSKMLWISLGLIVLTVIAVILIIIFGKGVIY